MKMTSILAALVLMLAGPAFALDVTLDTQSAKAVLKALKNSALTRSEALAVAALPGNQGLIRKAVSYKIAATTETFADALVASAHGAPLEAVGSSSPPSSSCSWRAAARADDSGANARWQ